MPSRPKAPTIRHYTVYSERSFMHANKPFPYEIKITAGFIMTISITINNSNFYRFRPLIRLPESLRV